MIVDSKTKVRKKKGSQYFAFLELHTHGFGLLS